MALFIMNFCLYCTLYAGGTVMVSTFKKVIQFDTIKQYSKTDSDVHIVKTYCCNCKRFHVGIYTTNELRDVIVRTTDEA